MNKFFGATLALAALLLFNPLPARASSVLPITPDQHIAMSATIFRGEVVSSESYADPIDDQIYTRTIVQVDEVFKGKTPAFLKLVHLGGSLDGRGVIYDFSPQLKTGEECLFFVSRRPDGSLFAIRGDASALPVPSTKNALVESMTVGSELLKELRAKTVSAMIPGDDVTDQSADPSSITQPSLLGATRLSASSTATNLLTGADGIPARFILPDRGETIPYLIDADTNYLPAGITQAQAITAVQNALAAWTNVSSVRYQFAGLQSFGMASANITNGDGYLRIQLHDHYNYITNNGGGGDILGIGGHIWTTRVLSPGWTSGGNVNGNDFHKVLNGFLVLASTNVAMQNLSTFTEVLCHEIGHSIGLAHSSQNPSEPNTVLKQAVMFFQVHADGRGATLNSFDVNVSRQIHPLTNTPPYMYDRVMDVVTEGVGAPNQPGVNVIQLKGYDLQTTNLTLATTDGSSGAGVFSFAGSFLTFTPNGFYEASRIDPASGSFYDLIYARCSDGTNASPFISARVIYLAADSFFEGIPDDWRQTWFGNIDPSAGPKRHATNDFDGDGLNNLQEFLLGSDPTSKTSNLRITSFTGTNLQWQAKPYEVYELQTSTDNTTWTRVGNPFVPTNATAVATNLPNSSPQQFFRILKVP